MLIPDKIKSLDVSQNISKQGLVVKSVLEIIDEGKLKKGDQLPSINQMVKKTGYARKTIVRSYQNLIEKGVVESIPQKGYFILNESTGISVKVALVLFEFGQIQEAFYSTLKKKLGSEYQIDVFFHHNDLVLFNNTMDRIMGKYGKYVIAPIQHKKVLPILQQLTHKKLLLIDRYIPLGDKYPYIVQEFEQSIYNCLMDIFSENLNYEKFVFFYDKNSIVPIEILNAVHKFLSENKIPGIIKKQYEIGSIKERHLYFVLSDTVLWQILGECKKKQLTLGKDIGILGHNDDHVKEIIMEGVTTLATDFKQMADMAAQQIISGKIIQKTMPVKLVTRNSL